MANINGIGEMKRKNKWRWQRWTAREKWRGGMNGDGKDGLQERKGKAKGKYKWHWRNEEEE